MKNFLIVLVILTLLLFNMFVFFVDQTEYAIVLRFGEFNREEKEAGLKFRIPFIETVYFFDNRVLDYDSEPTEIITKDKKTMVVDNFAKWKIIDPLTFFKSVTNVAGMLARLDDIIYSKLRVDLGKYDFAEIIGPDRTTIMENVTRRCNEVGVEYGIEIIDVRIKRADLPKENEQAVFSQMKAERNRIARQYRAEGQEEAQKITSDADRIVKEILSEAYKVSQETLGEAEKEAIKIYADAYDEGKEFFVFLKNLELFEKSFDTKTKLILSTDNEIFRLLKTME
ncbi:MAG: protease modulator HflC [Candidatus Muiribacteriota bacterium]